MEPKEVEEWKKNAHIIVSKITKKQIGEILMTFFELEDMPEVIAINRGNLSIKGFTKINKKVFMFDIAFIIHNNKYTLRTVLQFGKQTLMKDIEIKIEKNENEIDIFETNNRQYLFSIYF
jgi:hypothetical protein